MKLPVSELIDDGDTLRKDGPMLEYEFSEHAYDMLKERNIQQAWVKLAIENPEQKELKDAGMVHYIRSIEQYGGGY